MNGANTMMKDFPGTNRLRRLAGLRRLAIGLLSLAALGLSSLAGAADLYYLHTDHLDTPRVITDAQNTVVWRNDPLAEPFGLTPPDEDPDGDGTAFTFHLRFPGQYHDPETNTHYNVFRDYDPSTGRYIQSDPIGLEGGTNTYGYVAGNPLSRTDPKGLFWPAAVVLCEVCPVCCAAGAAAIGAAIANVCQSTRPKNPPDEADPNDWIQGPRRGRQYGPDGKPLFDVDKPHQGNPEPHVHEWPDGEREEPGRPFSPWPQK